MKYATSIDKANRTAGCECGEIISLPNVEEYPMLRSGAEVWFPELIAIRCTGCKEEVRLEVSR